MLILQLNPFSIKIIKKKGKKDEKIWSKKSEKTQHDEN